MLLEKAAKHFSHKEGIFRFLEPSYWVKIFNELKLTKTYQLGTKTGEEAEAHAAFFEELRKRGVFHPKTQFMVGEDDEGKPSVIALMPNLQLFKYTERHEGGQKADDAMRAILGEGISSNLDTTYNPNFGRDENNEVYLSDLHVLAQTPNQKVMQWFRKRKKAQKDKEKISDWT